ncbi:M48 family metalloprotease [Sphingomonas sp. ASY06-1R]|uniref:M48 family metalloprotease n=1 Tax=Sphingomonas sp. ASY06-1R TaxID=3445771 RepID=UPI003FA2FDD9
MSPKRLTWIVCAAVLAVALPAEQVCAQGNGPSILRDAETEQFLSDISAPMAVSAGLSPGALKLYIINDSEINAFVATGQAIYINSGTIQHSDNANELEGVIAHELGHIEGGDAVRSGDAMASAGRITLLSLLAGIAATVVAGPAGMLAMAAGQSAAQGKYLAYSRQQEGSADASAVRHLNDAHYSGKGMISFFGKLRQEEYRLTPSYTSIDPFAVDHPMTAERQAALMGDLEKSPWWNAPVDPVKQARYARIKAKLVGYLDEPPVVMNKFPERDQSIPAHYARAYAWHRSGYPDAANREVAALLAAAPHDPYFLELKGQILLESGKPADAIPPLREAVQQSRSTPLIAALLGNALVASENPDNLKEAAQVLGVAVQRDNENPQAWYDLGLVYTRMGDEARASLASAERFSLQGQPQMAAANAEIALRGIPAGTPDYIRAQDLALTARDEADRERRRKR